MKSFSGKTVLVTGATGLIGSHIVYELMSMKNVRVIALGRNIEKIKKIFKITLTMQIFIMSFKMYLIQ